MGNVLKRSVNGCVVSCYAAYMSRKSSFEFSQMFLSGNSVSGGQKLHDNSVSDDETVADKSNGWSPVKVPGHSKRSSESSSDISLPQNMKSAPAVPHVSDVNSVSMITNDATNDTINDLIAATVTPSMSPSKEKGPSTFFDNIISSLSFAKVKNIGNTDDLQWYGYDYASEDLNRKFHQLFKLIPQDDILIDVVSCNLNRSFPYEGNLYISQTHLCFNSNLLDWLAQIQIPISDILSIEKNPDKSIYTDEIAIETTLGVTRFNGFDKIDASFELLQKIFRNNKMNHDHSQFEIERERQMTSKSSDILNNSVGLMHSSSSQKASVLVGGICDKKKPSFKLITNMDAKAITNDEALDNLIRSIDDATSSTFSSIDNNQLKDLRVPIYKLKSSIASHTTYNGTYYNEKSVSTDIPTRSVNEFLLTDIELSCPPGILFQLIFNEKKPDFLKQFLLKQDSSNFTDIGKFELNDSGVKSRSYSYEKQLHFPVGPKSTLCNVEETVLHYDLDDYIELINTTTTPNVPSGGNFSTKTRYIIQWHESNRCKMRLSFWVEWTGNSWIKNMVESSCKSGLVSSTIDFVNIIEDFVENNTEIDYIVIDDTEAVHVKMEQSNSPSEISLDNKQKTSIVDTDSIIVSKMKLLGNKLTISLLIANIILFTIMIYFMYQLNSNLSKLLQLQGYNSDGIAATIGRLYETPARSEIINSNDQTHKLIESLKLFLSSLAAGEAHT